MFSIALGVSPSVSENQSLQIAVISVTWQSPDVAAIHYTLKNARQTNLYIPYFEIAGSTQLASYSLLHQTNDGSWSNLGPSHDLPPEDAKILEPGKSLTIESLFSGSNSKSPADNKGGSNKPSIQAGCCYRIRVGYYVGAQAWRKFLDTGREQQKSRQMLKFPPLEFAFSEQFEITAGAK